MVSARSVPLSTSRHAGGLVQSRSELSPVQLELVCRKAYTCLCELIGLPGALMKRTVDRTQDVHMMGFSTTNCSGTIDSEADVLFVITFPSDFHQRSIDYSAALAYHLSLTSRPAGRSASKNAGSFPIALL